MNKWRILFVANRNQTFLKDNEKHAICFAFILFTVIFNNAII